MGYVWMEKLLLKCQRRRIPSTSELEINNQSNELKSDCKVISCALWEMTVIDWKLKYENTSQWTWFVVRFDGRQIDNSFNHSIIHVFHLQNVYAKAASRSYLRASLQGGCYGRKEGLQRSKTSRARKYSKLARYQNDAIAPIERIGSITVRMETLLLVSERTRNEHVNGEINWIVFFWYFSQVFGKRRHWILAHILAFAIGNRSIDIETCRSFRTSSCSPKYRSTIGRCQQNWPWIIPSCSWRCWWSGQERWCWRWYRRCWIRKCSLNRNAISSNWIHF